MSFHINRRCLSLLRAAVPAAAAAVVVVAVVVDESDSRLCLFGCETAVEDADADADASAESGIGEARLLDFRDEKRFSNSSFISLAVATEPVEGMISLLYLWPQVGSKLIMTIARALPRPGIASDGASVM